eukprot:1831467-Rhodomonas_salina.1
MAVCSLNLKGMRVSSSKAFRLQASVVVRRTTLGLFVPLLFALALGNCFENAFCGSTGGSNHDMLLLVGEGGGHDSGLVMKDDEVFGFSLADELSPLQKGLDRLFTVLSDFVHGKPFSSESDSQAETSNSETAAVSHASGPGNSRSDSSDSSDSSNSSTSAWFAGFETLDDWLVSQLQASQIGVGGDGSAGGDLGYDDKDESEDYGDLGYDDESESDCEHLSPYYDDAGYKWFQRDRE